MTVTKTFKLDTEYHHQLEGISPLEHHLLWSTIRYNNGIKFERISQRKTPRLNIIFIHHKSPFFSKYNDIFIEQNKERKLLETLGMAGQTKRCVVMW